MLVPYPISNKSALNLGLTSSMGTESGAGEKKERIIYQIENWILDRRYLVLSFVFSGLF